MKDCKVFDRKTFPKLYKKNALKEATKYFSERFSKFVKVQA